MQLNIKNIVAASFFIIALSFAYYFVIFLPNKEKTKQELEWKIKAADLEEKHNNRLNFESCISAAWKNMQADWDLSCKNLNEKENCNLPRYNADLIEKRYNGEQELCIKKYK